MQKHGKLLDVLEIDILFSKVGLTLRVVSLSLDVGSPRHEPPRLVFSSPVPEVAIKGQAKKLKCIFSGLLVDVFAALKYSLGLIECRHFTCSLLYCIVLYCIVFYFILFYFIFFFHFFIVFFYVTP